MTYLAGVDIPTILGEIYTSRLFMWASEKGSRSCTCRGQSFSQPDPRLFVLLSRRMKHTNSISWRCPRTSKRWETCRWGHNRSGRKHWFVVRETIFCFFKRAQSLVQELGSNFPCSSPCAVPQTLTPSSHSPFHFTCCCHFNFPY